MANLDLIVPGLNEAPNLPALFERIHRALSSAHISYRIIFVDDRSTDNTASVIKRLSHKYPIIYHLKSGRPGKAIAIFEGAELASSDYVAMLDSDLQYPPEILPQMYALTKDCGLVIAHRRQHHTSRLRGLVSRLNKYIFGKLLLGWNYDTQSGLKIFRRDIINRLNSAHISSWAIDVPLVSLALDLGYSVGEVDIDFAAREHGTSKIRLSQATWQIVRSAVVSKFASRKVYEILPDSDESSIGAGMIHHRHRYITHSSLPSHLSAVRTVNTWQKYAIIGALITIAIGLFLNAQTTITVLLGILSFIYLIDVFFNFFIVYKSLNFPPEYSFTDDQLAKLDSAKLPIYTILVPVYREANVLPALFDSLSGLDWPKDKLDVQLLLEADDQETITAAQNLGLPAYIRSVVVPHSFPKTKPKACNYGLNLAKGEYVVIYDAEDRPDPLQLKKAYLAFQKSSRKTACLQGKLNYFNPQHNLLTRLFTAEYSLWFDVILPGLQSIGTTIPLGGTSNHFRTSVLRELQGWDAFNVTEDCDLGARLFKSGYRTAIIDSTTLEEANSKVGNWIRQRSRWIKGYIQTFLVHNRHPLTFFRRHGLHALVFQLIIGMRISFMVINPLLWVTTIAYFLLYRHVGPAIESVYPAPVFYMAAFAAVFGNFMFLFNYMIGCAKRGRWELVKYVYLIPFYWVLISIAAFKAVYQLIVKPYYWEKTHHGLGIKPAAAAIPASNFSPLTWPRLGSSYFWKLIKSEHLPKGALIFSAVFGNFFNFLYNTYLGRNVTSVEFGLVGLVGSFIYLFSVPLGALSNTITFRSAYLKGKLGLIPENLRSYFLRRTILISSCLALLWILATPYLTSVFHSSNLVAFWIFAPVLVMGSTIAVNSGVLAGGLNFGLLAVATIVESLSKFLWTYAFVTFGRSELVYLSIPLSMFFSFVFYAYFAQKASRSSDVSDAKVTQYFPRHFFFTSILTGISSVAFFSLDIILAKQFLSPRDAGIYTLISLIGKMVYFIGKLSSQFITPMVSHAEGAGKDSSRIFNLVFLSGFAFSFLAFIILGIFSRISGPLLFGAKIIPALPFLTLYSAGMVAFTLSTIIVSYHQTKQHYELPFLAFLITGLQIVGLNLFHANLSTFVLAMFVVALVNLVVTGIAHLFYPQVRVIFNNSIDFLNLFIPWKNGHHLQDGKLRILIFNWRDTKHNWGGGAEVYLQEIAKRWTSSGHHVTLFCGNDGRSPRSEVVDGVKIVRHGGFFTVYFWAAVYYLTKFIGRFDVIIDSENGIPFFTPLFSHRPVVLLIHHVHQEVFRQNLPPLLSSIAIFLESRLMPVVYRKNYLITVSQSSKRDITNILKMSPAKITVVNPGIDPAQFSPGPKTPHPSFVYLGRIRPYKNIDVAIRAFRKVLNKYPQATLTIAGWGESLPALRQLVRQLRLTKSVDFRERVSESEKVALLQRSWVMLQPSSFEGWGITVIEANACGTPVIASDTIGLRDSVVNNQTGILVPCRNDSAMAQQMIELINNPVKLDKLSQNSLAWSANFDWSVKSEEFMKVITSALSTRTNMSLPQLLNIYLKREQA